MNRTWLLLALASACVNVPPFAGSDGSIGDGPRPEDADTRPRVVVHVANRVDGAPITGARVYFGDRLAPTGTDGVAWDSVTAPVAVTVVSETTSRHDVVWFASASNGDELFVGAPDTRTVQIMPVALSLMSEQMTRYEAYANCGTASSVMSQFSLPRSSRCMGPDNNVLLLRRSNLTNEITRFRNVVISAASSTYTDQDNDYTEVLRREITMPMVTSSVTVEAEFRALSDGQVVQTTSRSVQTGSTGISLPVAAGADPLLEYQLSASFAGAGKTRFLRRQPQSLPATNFVYTAAPPRPTSVTVNYDGATNNATGVTWQNSTGAAAATFQVFTATEVRDTRQFRWRWIRPADNTQASFTFPTLPVGVPTPGSGIAIQVQQVAVTASSVVDARTIADHATEQPTHYFTLPGVRDVALSVGESPQ